MVNVEEQLRYKKFTHESPRVLLLMTRYFLIGEIIDAMRRLNIPHRLVTIDKDEMGSQEFVEAIIKAVLMFKPDFILTINHMGLDREGVLSDFLKNIEMPLASWYVDNPNLIIKQYKQNVTNNTALFLWDQNNLKDMRSLGFENVFHLPLGVNDGRFKPFSHQNNPFSHLYRPTAFVGNSMVAKVKKRLKKLSLPKILLHHFKDIAGAYMHEDERHVVNIIEKISPTCLSVYEKMDKENKTGFDAAVTWEATKSYRLTRIKKLLGFNPLIVGDPHWEEIMDPRWYMYHSELNYYEDLPYIYNLIPINFNATSRQMKGALNQRIFDVPACNGFLITDYQEQIEEIFSPGKEIVCYNDPEEIDDLIRYYLINETERKKIARKGMEKVLKFHTYKHRVTFLINKMKKIFS